MLQQILAGELKRRGISQREAATEIGVSNTTVHRILKGEAADIDTLEKISAWMNIQPGTMIGMIASGNVKEKVEIMLELYPKLGEVFNQLAEHISQDGLSPEDYGRLVGYLEGWIASKYRSE